MTDLLKALNLEALGIASLLIRSTLAVMIGIVIGLERSRHGRAAGMRTHVLVCLGSALTAMTGVFLVNTYHVGDMMRLAAQVISGVGFLGAGMIMLKNDNMITGLTTAAGVWGTATAGIAVGFGFYSGAIVTTVLFLLTLTVLSKLEKKKKNTEVIYLEIAPLERLNSIMDEIRQMHPKEPVFRVINSKTGDVTHIGLEVVTDRRNGLHPDAFQHIEGVIFSVENT